MTAPVPLVIDGDPGIDDAVAILLALGSPEVDLRLVTTVFGNAGVSRTTENALRVLHLAGRADVPVAAGAGRPLVARPRPADAVAHGPGGLGGVELPPSPAPPDPRPAAVAIADVLRESAAAVTVAATGPLTNLALLLGTFPDLAARIGRLVVMGGSAARGGSATAVAETNVFADPEAAAAVLGAGLPTTLVGLDVTVPTVLSPADLARLSATGPLGRWTAALLERHLPHSRAAHAAEGVVVHDALAVAEAVVPGTVGTVRRCVLVDTGAGPGRGQTLIDRRSVAAAPEGVEVAETVDSRAAVELILGRLAWLDRR